jgi:hypothetical protein
MSGQNELDVSGPGIPRRRALRVAAAAALATVVWSPSASAEPVGRIDNDEALEGALPALSNWGDGARTTNSARSTSSSRRHGWQRPR